MSESKDSDAAARIPGNLLLPMMDVQKSPLRRAAANASMTKMQDSGVASLKVQCFVDLQERIRGGGTAHGVDVDGLDAAKLCSKLNAKSKAIAEIAAQEAMLIDERFALIRELSSGKPSRAQRLLAELAEKVVDEELESIRTQINRVTGGRPFDAAIQAEQVSEAIDDILIPDTDHTSIGRLRNAVNALTQLQAQPNLVPAAQRDQIAMVLQQKAELLSTESMMAICLEHISRCMHRAIKSLQRDLQNCKAFGGEFLLNMSAVRHELELLRREVKHQDASAADGLEIVLPGPDEPTLRAAMLSQEGLRDLSELIVRQLETLKVRLAAVAKAKYPSLGEHAPIGELLTRIDAKDIASAICELVDHSIGTKHTVFSAVKVIGVPGFVESLLNKANVLVDLGGYKHSLLHISPIDQVLVRFPQRVGDDDEQVYLELKKELSAKYPKCLFADAGDGERDIKCIRTLVGFPIGVEQLNACLLESYAQCDPHPPHLVGVVSSNGEALADARLLFKRRNS